MIVPTDQAAEQGNGAEHHEVIIIGAGFGGLYGVHRLRGQGLDVLCIEAADDVGGVWLHNGYPGARCDLLSIDYSYSFAEDLQQDWHWSQRYSPQPEILNYLRHVADRFDLRRSIRFGTRVTSARRDEPSGRWQLTTDAGQKLSARHLVMACGAFSAAKEAEFPGTAEFRGELYRTSSWPRHPVQFEGKRVAIFGTGSSGVQAITEIAKSAGHLTVFQRTPAYTAPSRNRPADPGESAQFREGYADYRARMRDDSTGAYMFTSGRAAGDCTPEERRAILDSWWEEGGMGYATAFSDVLFDAGANEVVADYVRGKMAERISDPTLREKLIPRDYPVGTRRPVCDAGYLEIFAQPNVSLVDLRETPIVRFTETGIETHAGHQDFDMIVLAIGFDAITGGFTAINPVNGSGEGLADHWRDGARSCFGITVADFPNLFLVNGPGAAVAANIPMHVELTIDWIGDCIAWMNGNGFTELSPTAEAEDGWTDEVLAIGEQSLFMKTPSWFTGGNIPGKKRGLLVYLGGFNNFAARLRAEAEAGYPSFRVKAPEASES
jgi:cation diffusion facilitator CzcD-associated flavoprotein CzcO